MLSNDNPSTRERSLRAALDVVRDEGLHELTTRAIARRSGLTQPAIYRHFSGVDELIRETLRLVRGLVFERLEEAAGLETPWERLVATLGVFRDFAIEEPRLYEALFLQSGEGAHHPPPAEAGRRGNIFGMLVERVTDCSQAGVLKGNGPVATALTLAAHAQGLVLLYRQGRFGSRERFAEAYDRSMEGLLRGLRNGSSA